MSPALKEPETAAEWRCAHAAEAAACDLLRAERDALRAERDAAVADVARLRAVIAEAAEQRAEALAAEVERLRAGWAEAVAEVAAMGAEPDTTGQVLTERRSPATRAALREVARMLAEAQPAEVTDA